MPQIIAIAFQTIIALLLVVILVVSWRKKGLDWLSIAVRFAKMIVKSAEVTYPEPKSGYQKYIFAKEGLMELFAKYGREVDYEIIATLIEGAVATEIHKKEENTDERD